MGVEVYIANLAVGDTIPPQYAFYKQQPPPRQLLPTVSVPVIDFALLQSGTPEERTILLQDLANACRDWGFFTLINHGVPHTLMKDMLETCVEFFELQDDKKKKYEGKDVLDPIRCGTSYRPAIEKLHLWRDFLKIMVHPKFSSPEQPVGFSDVAKEYSQQIRDIATYLIQAIFKTIGMDEEAVETATDLERCNQILIANYYPACPQPHLAAGLPPHSDHGLLTLLIDNGVSGFQLFREGNWVNVNTVPNSILVNVADQMEIISNGKYKSVLHRAAVNAEKLRSSVALAHGPSLHTVVKPFSELLNGDNTEQLYEEMSYKEYLRKQQSNQLYGKTVLDTVRVKKRYCISLKGFSEDEHAHLEGSKAIFGEQSMTSTDSGI